MNTIVTFNVAPPFKLYPEEGCDKIQVNVNFQAPSGLRTCGHYRKVGSTEWGPMMYYNNASTDNRFSGIGSITEYGDWEFELTSTKESTISGSQKLGHTDGTPWLTIPESSASLASIGVTIKSIKIGDNVTGINDGAIANYPTLADVEVSSQVESIGSNFLYNCNNLTNLVVNTDASPIDNYSLSSTDASAKMYTSGVNVTGSGSSTWITNLPNRDITPSRRLTSTTASRKTLKDSDGNIVYPTTKASVTYLKDNVTTVQTALENKIEAVEPVSTPDVATIVATKIKQLKDPKNGDDIIPRSLAEAVFTGDGTSVEQAIKQRAKITLTDTDPGEGSPLANGEYAAVYGSAGLIQTSDIANNAVTADKINWTNIPEKVGSDDNYCLKFPSGLMIACMRNWQPNKNCSQGWGSIFASNGGQEVVAPNYATPFVSTPTISAFAATQGGNCWLEGRSGTSTATSPGSFDILRGTSNTSVSFDLNVIAIGFWK